MYVEQLKVESKEIKDLSRIQAVLTIHQDDCAQSPRDDENLGTIAHCHRSYNLGEEQFNYGDDLKDHMESIKNDILTKLPVYLFDHSGITISTSGFSCRWDSGQVGWIYVTKDRVRTWFGVERISKKLKARVETYLEHEIERFDEYLRGDVYGYTMKDAITGEDLDESCWGFYGSDVKENGMLDNISKERYNIVEVKNAWEQ